VIRSRSGLFCLAAAGLLTLAIPSWGQAASPNMSSIASELDAIDADLRGLEKSAQKRPDVFGEDRIESQLNTATLLLQQAGYPTMHPAKRRENLKRASFFLAKILQSPFFQRSPQYPDALFKLGEALYQLGNLRAAEDSYGELLTRSDHGFAEKCIVRLIDIAARTGRYELFDTPMSRYRRLSGGRIPVEVQYLQAKALFFQEKDNQALQILRRIPPGNPHGLRARYLWGAIYTRKGQLEKATQIFSKVAFAKPVAKEDALVKHMAHLARGRLAYDMGDISAAVDAFNYIPFDSELFPETLFEITWAYIRRGQLVEVGELDPQHPESSRLERARLEYAKALEYLDMLLMMETREEMRPRLKVLIGNLWLQRGAFDKAQFHFEDLLKEFEPTYQALQKIKREATDPALLVEEILKVKEGGKPDGKAFPEMAARWAARNPDVVKLLGVFDDMRTSQKELMDTRDLLGRLERSLNEKQPEELVHSLKSQVAKSRRAERKLLQRLGEVSDALGQALASASEADRQDLATARRERTRWQEKLLNPPDTAAPPAPEAPVPPPAEEASDGKAPQGEERAPATPPAMTEDDVRQSLERWILQEGEILARMKSQVGGGPHANQLQQTRARIVELRRRNQAYIQRVRSQVSEEVETMRRVVAEERRRLDRYAEGLESHTSDAGTMAAEAARLAVEHVLADIDEIVIKGDVGIVDTAFQRKHTETKLIGEYEQAKARELTDLNRAYADLEREGTP
jgi:tetratricopeptide (TPR) repeat protein